MEFALVLVVFCFIVLASSIKIVPQGYEWTVETWGRYTRTLSPGLHIITPIIERESLTDSYKVCKILPAKIGENIGDYAALAIAISED